MPGPSVFPSGEPGVSGDFWGSQEGPGAHHLRQSVRMGSDHRVWSCTKPEDILTSRYLNLS